ncbi:hypothetical protein M408DRAFT_197133 [Serendipita vermifera MAFF 305830]|uniref:Uncharacterized protein n=1 Tax=Serendipita vermifera MAFF 305830 TaxID=933852 RepID=A0A0C3B3X2_SERVB|nr:hypothetical protein M408DRAFT_197133 [Serendipita vermifera MAFF 305830]
MPPATETTSNYTNALSGEFRERLDFSKPYLDMYSAERPVQLGSFAQNARTWPSVPRNTSTLESGKGSDEDGSAINARTRQHRRNEIKIV